MAAALCAEAGRGSRHETAGRVDGWKEWHLSPAWISAALSIWAAGDRPIYEVLLMPGTRSLPRLLSRLLLYLNNRRRADRATDNKADSPRATKIAERPLSENYAPIS